VGLILLPLARNEIHPTSLAKQTGGSAEPRDSTMLKTTIFPLLAATLLAFPAIAQSTKPVAADQKQCADQFKAADLNNDGVLDRTEIGNAKQGLPASLANKDRVPRTEFMAVCSKRAS
jgi:hypothetical protein